MSDLISRQAVNKIIDKWLSNPFYELKDHIYEMTKKIHELPSADVRENIHGTWEHWKGEKFFDVPVCSNCGMTFSINARGWSFCPNCGDDKRKPTKGD